MKKGRDREDRRRTLQKPKVTGDRSTVEDKEVDRYGKNKNG